ncbi:hypothetical protein [Rhodohalobacter sp. SW132]|nr:hypothetical protein [Rhodohalobacter sp. SW132]
MIYRFENTPLSRLGEPRYGNQLGEPGYGGILSENVSPYRIVNFTFTTT